MATLYILCGPSGSGKSTWARNFILESDRLGSDVRYVSRDEIRYSLLKDGEDYFSHEKEVFKRFAGTLRHTLIDGFDVVADATHLNERSRNKVLKYLDLDFVKIIPVNFLIDFDMCRDFRAPTLDEDSRIIEIKEVGD